MYRNMEENNLVQEIYPEEIKSLNPYDISYIAMKNGSIIMIIEKTPSIINNRINKYYKEEKKEQNSPNFNIEGRKYMSYIKENNINQKRKNDLNKNMNINNKYNEENNILNYSFRSSDDKRNNNPIKRSITNNNYTYNIKNEINEKNEEKNPCVVEKRKYIFYKKSNNNEKTEIRNNNFSPLKHSKTFSYTISTPTKRKNSNINTITNLDNSSFRKKYSNNIYNNISIRHSKYSSKKNNPYKNSTYDSIVTYDYIKSKSENINLNNNYNCSMCNNRKIEYTDDFTLNKNNHSELNDLMIKDYQNNFRPRTPIYTMRNLGRKNHRKFKANNKNNNLELKKYLSKDNHRYYERKELSAPKQSNYYQKRSINGSTIHVFEN